MKGVRIKLKDGSVLEVLVEITSVIKIGHDINNGAPVYNVQSQFIIKNKSIPKELFKKKSNQPSGYQ